MVGGPGLDGTSCCLLTLGESRRREAGVEAPAPDSRESRGLIGAHGLIVLCPARARRSPCRERFMTQNLARTQRAVFSMYCRNFRRIGQDLHIPDKFAQRLLDIPRGPYRRERPSARRQSRAISSTVCARRRSSGARFGSAVIPSKSSQIPMTSMSSTLLFIGKVP